MILSRRVESATWAAAAPFCMLMNVTLATSASASRSRNIIERWRSLACCGLLDQRRVPNELKYVAEALLGAEQDRLVRLGRAVPRRLDEIARVDVQLLAFHPVRVVGEPFGEVALEQQR